MRETKNKPDVLTRKQAAEYLSICPATLAKLDIPHIQVRRRVLYREADIAAWMEAQKKWGAAI
jgi:hypothetical protein